jgi:hypothetical protein
VRRRYALAIALVVAAAVGLAAIPSRVVADGGPCGVAGARVLKESRYAIVAKRRIRGSKVTARYYGCLRTTGRPVLLAEEGSDPSGDELYVSEEFFRLRGRFAAVAPGGCSAECAPPSLEVFDLRSGQRVRSIYPRGGYRELLKVLLSSRGALAYVSTDTGGRPVLGKADSNGHRVLARASRRRLPLSSVTLHGSLLAWVLDGDRHTLRLR